MANKKKQALYMGLTLLVLLVGFLLLEGTRTSTPASDYDLKLEAAERAEACFASIRDWKAELGKDVVTASDINGTGMIGLDYSMITTTLGVLEAKRTSTNPNMAAVLIDMFTELELQPGDKVAVNCSGSFPALNIATICAAETMGLEPILMSSFGASTHGANDPDMVFQDMEHHLREAGLISTKSRFVSIGGNRDIGTEMPDQVKQEILDRLRGEGYEIFYDEDLVHNVLDRYEYYRNCGDIKCFINVGGNDVSFGDSSVMVHADGGIITQLAENDHTTGLIQLFLADQIPVIHLLNIKTLAADYGMPIDPKPMPEVGHGGVFYVDCYHRSIAVIALALALVPLYLWSKETKKKPKIV